MGLWPNASQFDSLSLGISRYLPDALMRQRERLVHRRGLKKVSFLCSKDCKCICTRIHLEYFENIVTAIVVTVRKSCFPWKGGSVKKSSASLNLCFSNSIHADALHIYVVITAKVNNA